MKPILPILLIILSFAVFYMYIDPTYADVRELQSEAKEYKQALEKAQALTELKTTLVNRYNTFTNDNLLRLEKMVPSEIDNVRLTAEIDGIGEKYGIKIRAIRVQENRSRTNASTNITEPLSEEYKTVIMTFSFNATYEKFIQFMSDLESNLRIVDFSNISFTVSSGMPTFSYQVTMKTYWLP
ncbi:MAG: type 4a pilus biogenesis protein PilO [Patescibacteria group bacterium]